MQILFSLRACEYGNALNMCGGWQLDGSMYCLVSVDLVCGLMVILTSFMIDSCKTFTWASA